MVTAFGGRTNGLCLIVFDSKIENFENGTISYRFKLINEKNELVFISKNKYLLGHGIWQSPYYYYSEERTKLKCIKIIEETLLWQFSVSELGKYKDFDGYFKPIEKEGEVRKILGVFDEVLVAQISGGESANENQLLGLNIQTGRQEWIISGISDVCANLQANNTQTHLLGIRDREFIEIDLKTAQISRNKDIQSVLTYQDKTIAVKCMSIKDQHIFFTGSFSGLVFHSGVIGAFNIETVQLDWLHDMEFDRNTNFNMSSTPQIEGNRLYALDSGGTLHIFEREEK
jgi:outer membrane protein assembly factor BamB